MNECHIIDTSSPVGKTVANAVPTIKKKTINALNTNTIKKKMKNALQRQGRMTIASHADVLRGSSRVPAPRTFVGQERVTNP